MSHETTSRTGRPREGGDLLVEALAARGVRQAFTVSGGPINSVYHASVGSAVDLRHVRHEGAAGFMADATYRTTGVPGVAVVTLGPGVTNMATPLGTALRAGSAVLVIGAQAPTSQVDKGAGMELSTLAAMRPLVKWAASVPRADRIAEYVDRAWRTMLAPTPGPVYLEIPADVLSAQVPDDVTATTDWRQPHRAAPHPDAVREVTETLQGARRPVVLVGDGVHYEGCGDDVRDFLTSNGLPFATLRLARGAVDERSDLFVGPGYVPANPAFRRALDEADVVLMLGHDWEFDLGFGEEFPRSATVVHVHEDASKLGRVTGTPDITVVSAVAPFLAALPDGLFPDLDRSWVSVTTQAWRTEHATTSSAARRAEGLHPVELIDEVRRAAPDPTCFVTSHGNIDFWADGHLVIPAEGRYLRAGQSGSLGAEVPFAIAAKLADPERPVVVFLGDGAIGYHGAELDTAVRYGANVVVVVADDQKWGAIAMPQRTAYGVEVEMDLERRDWVGFARSLGAQGEYVSDLAELGGAVERALKADRPSVLQVPMLSVLSPYMAYTTS
ncbi:thiamine pyrophosphate-binding protein [Amycolatopsis jejuensis]|uniref:thiamine pyrophosphate-binding protein n=1 Tax=Amycolatopsis jejuensis TaxID=330084 RepID=UPI0005256520|nr:thiamine pyrophosphate-binding protein [Amycolatopsis jejuensis]